jgi:glucokinase
LTYNGSEYDVWASEGGHCDFAPRDETEWKLLEYFKRTERVPRVSVERICSGLGLPRIYDFMAHLHPQEVSPAVTARLITDDPGSVIAECKVDF